MADFWSMGDKAAGVIVPIVLVVLGIVVWAKLAHALGFGFMLLVAIASYFLFRRNSAER